MNFLGSSPGGFSFRDFGGHFIDDSETLAFHFFLRFSSFALGISKNDDFREGVAPGTSRDAQNRSESLLGNVAKTMIFLDVS